MCDPYLYTVARWMEGDGVDINRFPKVKAQFDAIKARPRPRGLSRRISTAFNVI